MFVSLRLSKYAFIGAGVFGATTLLMLYQGQQMRNEVDVQYYSLLKKQTAEFASSQAEQKRLNYIEKNKTLFEFIQTNKNTEQLRKEVLAQLEKITMGEGLLEAKYEFLAAEQLVEINSNTQVLRDSLRVKGLVSNMVVLDQAFSQLDQGVRYFFDIRSCSIKRRTDSASGLLFDCLLSWYFLA